ncbi:PepSY domain-containing protein [Saccharopolyspora thermophila]|uniref:PepSY-associated TM helix domain-containing protein n=1 Tax=Saccharopolyspora thermophila TaxID=89367 RepID=A0ABP3NAQ8_9PSEU
MTIEQTGAETASPQRESEQWWPALRPLVLRLHFYAGIFVGPFLALAALTGLLYAFTPQLEQALYDRELHVPAGPVSHPLSVQVDAARAALPGAEVKSVRPALSPTDTTQVVFTAADLPDSYYRTAFVDPHTAEVRGVLETYGSSQALPLRTWIDQLHRGLHLGEPGRIYSELAASWLWVVVLGGILLWIRRRRPSRRALLVPLLRGSGRRRVLSWHGAVGLWAALGFLFLSATGLTWSAYAGERVASLRSALSWETPSVATGLPHPAAGDIGIDRVLRIATAHGLTGPVEITPPDGGATAYQVQQIQRRWPTQQDSIAVDPGTGQVTDVVRFADYPLAAKLTRWGIDAHMGLLFGWVNQLVLAGLAVALLALVLWGYRMWWLRRPTRRFGAPPERGAWRRVPGRVLAPIILAAGFVGVALPLLGASLVLFLLVDVALGAHARRRTSGA